MPEHLHANMAGSDFAQRGDGMLVTTAFELGSRTLRKLPRTIGRCQRQLETVGDFLQTVFDGDSGHLDNAR